MNLFGVDKAIFKARLRAIRLEKKLTQEQVAARAGLNEKFYQDLESGRRDNPTLETLNALASALETPVYALLYEFGELKSQR